MSEDAPRYPTDGHGGDGPPRLRVVGELEAKQRLVLTVAGEPCRCPFGPGAVIFLRWVSPRFRRWHIHTPRGALSVTEAEVRAARGEAE